MKRNSSYQICSLCVMDTSDPDILFDPQGTCNHCASFSLDARAFPINDSDKTKALDQLVAKIKKSGKSKPYDCVIGLSGGVDSSFVGLKVKELGLRPLAVHFDNHWNSEVAIHNIQTLAESLNLDLITHVVEWKEFRELQLAFLRASVPDIEIPTDHGVLATLIKAAKKYNVGYILSGTNHSSEGVLPVSYAYGMSDWRYIQSIHRTFGNGPIESFPRFSLISRLNNILVRRLRNIGILNYYNYSREQATTELKAKLDWKPYGEKHSESIFTRFVQGFVLPHKFGIDKRRAHYSSLICSKQMTREEALLKLKSSPYASPTLLNQDKEYILKKLGLSSQSFNQILSAPKRSFNDYATYHSTLERLRFLKSALKQMGLVPKRVGL